jgi:hypothetical protein
MSLGSKLDAIEIKLLTSVSVMIVKFIDNVFATSKGMFHIKQYVNAF